MKPSNPLSPEDLTIRDLYPDLAPAEAQHAEANLERYLELALRIYARIRQDPEAYQQFKALTGTRAGRIIGDERSS